MNDRTSSYTDFHSIHDFVEYMNEASTSVAQRQGPSTPISWYHVILFPFQEFVKTYFASIPKVTGVKKFVTAVYASLFVLAVTSKQWELQQTKKL